MIDKSEEKNKSIGNLVGLDIGKKYTGIAAYLCNLKLFLPISSSVNKKILDKSFLQDIFDFYNPSFVVLGYPLDYFGKVSKQCFFVYKMLKLLKLSYPDRKFILHNELLSTKEALSRLKEIKKIKDKKRVDDLSACIILEDFLSN